MILESSPTDDHLNELASGQPENPFATPGYARAREFDGSRVGLLRFTADDPRTWSLAILRTGRLRRSLEIPSLPCRLDEERLVVLRRMSADRCITNVSINTYGSPADAVIVDEDGAPRHTRTEYVLDLAGPDDLVAGFSKTYRNVVRKAIRSGVTVEELPPDSSMSALVRLHEQSMDRREARGEGVPRGDISVSGQRLIDFAGARVFAAKYEGHVVAALLVLVSAACAYNVYSGNAPVGMQVGASHLLQAELAQSMQAEGRTILNLGGVSPGHDGLADFKRRFGTVERPLANYSFDTMSSWESAIRGVIRRLGPR